MSVVGDDAEWQTRKISVFGAVKSFISQLTVGQDLLRVSLPSAFVYPYSGLELGALKALEYYEILRSANDEENAVRRLLKVAAYYVSRTSKAQFEKKPSNPILGENHYAWIEGKKGKVFFFAEQVSHHPPISAYYMQAKGDEISNSLNFESSGIKFYGNSVGVSIVREERIQLHKFEETYIINKSFPDMMIRNVVLGTKRETWEGDVIIACEKTGLKLAMNYKEEGWWCVNVVNGTVVKTSPDGDIPIVKINATVSTNFKTIPLTADETGGTKSDLRKGFEKEEVISDYTTAKKSKLQYLPESEWDDRSSLRIWKDMFRAIIADECDKADEAKKEVEEAQRARRKDNKNFEPQFFDKDVSSDFWSFKFNELENVFENKKKETNESEKTEESTPEEEKS